MSINTVTTKIAGGLQAGFPDGLLGLGAPVAVAAKGSAQADAAALSYGLNVVSGADATVGVILPAATPGAWVATYSSAATNALPVYPASGGTIDDGSANASFSTTARKLMIFVATSSTNWAALKSA